jgi:hypothetical protein
MNSTSARRRARVGIALVVALLAAALSPAISAQADTTYSVSGHVALGTAAQSAGAGDVVVYALTGLGTMYNSPTDANGNYTVTGIPNQTYVHLYFDYVGSGSYGSLYYGGASTSTQIDQSDYFPVGAGITVAAKNITLPTSQLITGHVSLGSASGPPGAGLTVAGFRTDELFGTSSQFPTFSVQTDSSGNYSVTALAGLYALTITPLSSNYQVLRNAPVIVVGSPVSATEVILAKGQFTGHVTLGPTAIPAAAGQVAVTYTCVGEETSGVTCATNTSAPVYTDASGNYILGGLTDIGIYVLQFTDIAGTQYQPQSVRVVVPDPTATYSGINANLLTSAVLSGTVSLGTAGNLAPVGSVTVTAAGAAGSITTTTGSNGAYSLSLPAGEYEVSFAYSDPTKYTTSWWASPTAVANTQLTATPIGASSSPIPGINATMPLTSYISGTITRSNGVAVNGPEEWELSDALTGLGISDGETNSNGTYSLGPLVPGTYEIEFLDNSGLGLSRTYVGATLADPGAIGQVALGAGQTLANTNVLQFLNSSVSLNATCTNCGGSLSLYGQANVNLQRFDSVTSSWQEIAPRNQAELPYLWPSLVPGTYRTMAALSSNGAIVGLGNPFVLAEGQAVTTSWTVTIPNFAAINFLTLPTPITFPLFGTRSAPASGEFAASGSASATETVSVAELTSLALSDQLEPRVAVH